MVAGVALLLAAAAGAARRVALLWRSAQECAARPRADACLSCPLPSSWSVPRTRERRPGFLAQDSQGSSVQAPPASGSKAPASPRLPHARALSPRPGTGPLARDSDTAAQGGVLEARRMRCAMGLCLALHCASLFSNSFILAGRAVAHFLLTTLLLLWGAWECRHARAVSAGWRQVSAVELPPMVVSIDSCPPSWQRSLCLALFYPTWLARTKRACRKPRLPPFMHPSACLSSYWPLRAMVAQGHMCVGAG